jgi:hypothetical protein
MTFCIRPYSQRQQKGEDQRNNGCWLHRNLISLHWRHDDLPQCRFGLPLEAVPWSNPLDVATAPQTSSVMLGGVPSQPRKVGPSDVEIDGTGDR